MPHNTKEHTEMRIWITKDQAELLAHMIDLVDRGLESAGSHSELFGMPEDPEWESRMIEAGQQLAEVFPTRR